MILSNITIKRMGLITPCEPKGKQRGMSYGLSVCSYDIRVNLNPFEDSVRGLGTSMVLVDGEYVDGVVLPPGCGVLLGVCGEFKLPNNVVGFVKDKSTWARQGLRNAQAVLDPGWSGCLSVHVHNAGSESLTIADGDPIGQVVFHFLDSEPSSGYDGKYQGDGPGPQPAKFE